MRRRDWLEFAGSAFFSAGSFLFFVRALRRGRTHASRKH